ncbi:plasma-membrane choline transporter-domain-containing protein [Gorgonomyces haynaldii]|nr:plasma-membrane choline transporter-domain-containing protein [Gorgonomyces haynaldii]
MSSPLRASIPRRKVTRKVQETPQKPRQCQDVFCLFVFIFMGVLVAVGCYLTYTTGNLNRLLYGVDSYGELCSIDRPKLVYFNYSSSQSFKKCVNVCPDPIKQPLICIDNVQPLMAPPGQIAPSQTGQCALTTKTVLTIVFNRCVPVELTQGITGDISLSVILSWAKTLNADLLSQESTSSWQQVYANLDIIGYSCLVAIGACIVWFYLLQFFGTYMIYVTFLLATLLSAGTTGLLIYFYLSYSSSDQLLLSVGFDIPSSVIQNYKIIMIVAIVVMALLTIGLLVAIIASRHSIKIANQALAETADAFKDNKTLIYFPLANSLMTMFFGWIVVLQLSYISVNGVDKPTTLTAIIGNRTLSLQGKTFVPKSYVSPYTTYIEVVSLVWIFWVFYFVVALQHATISGAIAQWYFRSNKKSGVKHAGFKSYLQLLRYNIGSIAFGCVMRPAIYIWNWIYWAIAPSFYKAERKVNGQETFVDRLAKMLGQMMRCTSRNAYIEMPLYGPTCNFNECARLAHELLTTQANEYLD